VADAAMAAARGPAELECHICAANVATVWRVGTVGRYQIAVPAIDQYRRSGHHKSRSLGKPLLRTAARFGDEFPPQPPPRSVYCLFHDSRWKDAQAAHRGTCAEPLF